MHRWRSPGGDFRENTWRARLNADIEPWLSETVSRLRVQIPTIFLKQKQKHLTSIKIDKSRSSASGGARMALSRPTRAGLSTTAHPAIAMLQKRFSGRFCEIHSPDFLAEHLPGQLVSLGVNLDLLKSIDRGTPSSAPSCALTDLLPDVRALLTGAVPATVHDR